MKNGGARRGDGEDALFTDADDVEGEHWGGLDEAGWVIWVMMNEMNVSIDSHIGR